MMEEKERKSEKSRVILVPCGDYEPERVYQAMRLGIQELGGLPALIGRDERILVKPNFLSPAAPERAVTTHPAVITAMFRILSEEGYTRVSYGDSPGHGSCEGAARKLGLEQAAAKYGIVRANMEEEVLTEFPEGQTATRFYFAKGVTEADAIISLCKMKTHALERVTGAVKNVYGLICGPRKAAGHVKYPNAGIFARMLADIHRSRDIRLHIMDGIVAMEGNGPGSGDPTPMGVLLFSRDPVALDAVYCRLVDLDPETVPTCAQGQAMGIGTCRMREIEVVEASDSDKGKSQGAIGEQAVGVFGTDKGQQAMTEEQANEGQQSAMHCLADGVRIQILTEKELIKKYGNPNFRVERGGQPRGLLGRFSRAAQQTARRPVIKKELCVRCGICVSHCPVPGGAVNFQNGKENPPVYDYRKCIRCYCCQEMCPQHAISVGGRRRVRGDFACREEMGLSIHEKMERASADISGGSKRD